MSWTKDDLERALRQAERSLEEHPQAKPGPLPVVTPQVQRAAEAIERAVARGQATERWQEQRSRFVPIERRFRPEHYRVEPAPEVAARAFVETHHYSSSFAPARIPIGLYHHGAGLVGVAVFGPPPYGGVHRYQRERYRKDGRLLEVVNRTRRYVTYTVDGGEPIRVSVEDWGDVVAGAMDLRLPSEVFVELNRFVLLEEVPFDAESWFLARAFEVLHEALPEVLTVVSFSDPVPIYTAGGHLIMPGHLGTIYQAFNAIYRALSSPVTTWYSEEGLVVPERVLRKIKTGERGGLGGYGEEMLLQMGASPRRRGESGERWVKRVLAEGPFRRFRHVGKHTYLWTLGPRKRGLLRTMRPAIVYPGDPQIKRKHRIIRRAIYGR